MTIDPLTSNVMRTSREKFWKTVGIPYRGTTAMSHDIAGLLGIVFSDKIHLNMNRNTYRRVKSTRCLNMAIIKFGRREQICVHPSVAFVPRVQL